GRGVPTPGNSCLHESCSKRGKDCPQETEQHVVVTPAEHQLICSTLNHRTDRGGDRRGKNISVIYVHQLVAGHGPQLSRVQQMHDALGKADRSVLWITPGSKRIGLLGWGNINPWSRLPCTLRQSVDHIVETLELLRIRSIRLHAAQCDFI